MPEDIARDKPINREIDPGELLPGSGALHARPSKPALSSSSSKSTDNEETNNKDLELGQFTTVALHLYAEHLVDEQSNDIWFQMNRKSDETFSSTMKRLQINLEKNLNKKLKQSKLKNNKKQKVKQVPAAHDDNFAVWKLHDSSEAGGLIAQEEWDCLHLPAGHVWQEAQRAPLGIRLVVHRNNTAMILQFLVESNTPSLTSVQTFEHFGACLFVDVPIVISTKAIFASDVEVNWFLDGQLMQKDCPTYTPCSEDIGMKVSVLIRPTSATHDGSGCEEAYQFEHSVQQRPENTLLNLRPTWTESRPHNDNDLRVLTYNILADQNAFDAPGVVSRSCRDYVTPALINKKRRMPLVLHEILQYHADIVCLQEVDTHIYRNLLEPVMQHRQYQGVFTCKQSDGNNEGCATFWSLKRFEALKNTDYFSYAIRDLIPTSLSKEWESIESILGLCDRRPDLDHAIRQHLGHIAQMIPLRMKNSERSLIVCNTHLFFHPYGSHIRLLQAFALAYQLEKVKRSLDSNTATIFCGDLNSSLESAGGRLLTSGYVEKNSRSLKTHLNTFRYSNNEGLSSPTDDDFPAIRLPSSCTRLRSVFDVQPPVTHFIPGFVDTLDHILISDELATSNTSNMPDLEALSKHVAMPSPNLPSDHVSVIADVKFL